MKKSKVKSQKSNNEKLLPGILLKVINSEKVANLGVHAYKVPSNANKMKVKHAAEKNLGLKVKSVQIINVKSKPRRFRGILGRKPGYKKAIIKTM